MFLRTHRRGYASVSMHHHFGVSGMQRSGAVLRFAAGLEAWFCLPEHGMTSLEILARGSVFLTPSRNPLWPRHYHALTTAHVTHPWRFRRFYRGPEHDWLDAVRPEAVEVRLTVRELATGAIVYTAPLTRASEAHVHEELDLAVFALADEASHLEALLGDAGLLPLELAPTNSAPGSPVVLIGHDKVDETLIPCALNGAVVGGEDDLSREAHVMVQTHGDTSVMGMCGGPALVQVGRESVAAAGMVFARVDSPHPLQGHTVLVSAAHIGAFVDDIEKQKP